LKVGGARAPFSPSDPSETPGAASMARISPHGAGAILSALIALAYETDVPQRSWAIVWSP
jgi:hypothetical protein